MSGYRVLIVIKDQWWSDQVVLGSYAAAQRHRNGVAARWNDCDTAIAAPDGRVLGFEESLIEQAREREALEQAPASTSRASRASANPSPSVPSTDRA